MFFASVSKSKTSSNHNIDTCSSFWSPTILIEVWPLQVFFALLIVATAISHRSGLALDFTKAKGSAASILAILDLKSKIDTSDEGGMTLERVKGN